MTAKELKEVLADVPDNAEVYLDDGYSVSGIPVDNTEYDRYSNIVIIIA